jgi:hypothetical protein
MHRLSTGKSQLDHRLLAARHTAPAEGCAEPSQASALVDTDRLEAIMATMRPFGNCAAATVPNYLASLAHFSVLILEPKLWILVRTRFFTRTGGPLRAKTPLTSF